MTTDNTEQLEQVEEALKEHSERLEEFKKNDDSKGRILTLFDMAQLEIARADHEAAMLLLMEAYSLAKDLGDLSCLCPVAELLGQILYVAGRREEGFDLVRESLAGLKEAGSEEAANTEHLLDVMMAHDLANPLPKEEGGNAAD